MTRRLPVYIIIQTSDLMKGEVIESVQLGFNEMLRILHDDPFSLETVNISIINYDCEAKQILPLTPLYELETIDFTVSDRGTKNIFSNDHLALGEALELVMNRIDAEVIKSTIMTKGDMAPLLFLFSDGNFSSSLVKPIEEFQKRKRRLAIVVACTTSQKSNMDVLHSITDNVVQITTLHPDNIKSYCEWISNSIKHIGCRTPSNKISIEELLPLPEGVMINHQIEIK